MVSSRWLLVFFRMVACFPGGCLFSSRWLLVFFQVVACFLPGGCLFSSRWLLVFFKVVACFLPGGCLFSSRWLLVFFQVVAWFLPGGCLFSSRWLLFSRWLLPCLLCNRASRTNIKNLTEFRIVLSYCVNGLLKVFFKFQQFYFIFQGSCFFGVDITVLLFVYGCFIF